MWQANSVVWIPFTDKRKLKELRASAARRVISFMVLNLSRFKPKKLW